MCYWPNYCCLIWWLKESMFSISRDQNIIQAWPLVLLTPRNILALWQWPLHSTFFRRFLLHVSFSYISLFFPLMNTRSTEQTLSPSHSHRLLPVCAAAASCSLFLALVGWWPRVCWKRYNPWPGCKVSRALPCLYREREWNRERDCRAHRGTAHTAVLWPWQSVYALSLSSSLLLSVLQYSWGSHGKSHHDVIILYTPKPVRTCLPHTLCSPFCIWVKNKYPYQANAAALTQAEDLFICPETDKNIIWQIWAILFKGISERESH